MWSHHEVVLIDCNSFRGLYIYQKHTGTHLPSIEVRHPHTHSIFQLHGHIPPESSNTPRCHNGVRFSLSVSTLAISHPRPFHLLPRFICPFSIRSRVHKAVTILCAGSLLNRGLTVSKLSAFAPLDNVLTSWRVTIRPVTRHRQSAKTSKSIDDVVGGLKGARFT